MGVIVEIWGVALIIGIIISVMCLLFDENFEKDNNGKNPWVFYGLSLIFLPMGIVYLLIHYLKLFWKNICQ